MDLCTKMNISCNKCQVIYIFFRKILIILFFLILNPCFGKSQSFNISGYIRDNNGDFLIGANIVILDSDLGIMSDQNGHFSLNVYGADKIILKVSYIGYKPREITISTVKPPTLPMQIYLEREAIHFLPVEIIGQTTLAKLQIIEPSLKIMRLSEIAMIPSIGSADVFRAIQTLPGVSSTSEISNQLYIRGGTPDQNLTLIDGVPVYQPFHLFGLASSVYDASIDYVKYYSGGFSVRYGDRMSSVMDLITKPGTDSLTANIDWNLIYAGGTLAGSLGKKIRWRLTGRRTYYDQIGKQFDYNFPYYFYDTQAKISYQPNSKTLWTVNAFLSKDRYNDSIIDTFYSPAYKVLVNPTQSQIDSNTYYNIDISKVVWKNELLSLRWLKRHSPISMTEATAYVSLLKQHLTRQKAYIPHENASDYTIAYIDYQNDRWNYQKRATNGFADLYDCGLDIYHNYQLSDQIELLAGGGFSLRNLDYRWNIADFNILNRYLNAFMDYPPDSMDYQVDITMIYTFAEGLWHPREDIWLRLGIRPTWYSNYRKAIFEPRMNLTWAFQPKWKVRLGIGMFSQALSTSQEYGFYSIAGIYFPNLESMPTALHLIGGLNYDNRKNLTCDLAIYEKSFYNLMFIDGNGELAEGHGNSYGIELSGNYRFKDWISAGLAYTYSMTEKTALGETFYPNYDIRHKLTIQTEVKLFLGINLTGIWNFDTGRPANLYDTPIYIANWRDFSRTNPITNLPDVILQNTPYYFYFNFPKNAFRYPIFSRVDVSLNKKWTFKRSSLAGYVQIINLFNHKNVLYYKGMKEIKDCIYTADAQYGFPFLPTIGVRYEF